MERPSHEIITKDGIKCLIKSYLTYEEAERAFKIEDKVAQSSEIMKIAILSLDGVVEGAYDRVRKIPLSSYLEIAAQVANSVSGNFQPAK